MTSLRYILPGATYLVTRRCAQRQFLLHPSPAVKGILAYALAYAAAEYGVQVHAYCFLSNHYHLVLTDPYEQVPSFLQRFHSLTARALNAHYGRSESLWSPRPTSLVRLIELSDVIDKMLYTACNPVSSRVVKRSESWEGFRSRTSEFGKMLEFERPKGFFRESGPTPKTAELRLCAPPRSGAEFAEEFERKIEERERELREEAFESGQAFLGSEGVAKCDHETRATTEEPQRQRAPHIACKNPVRRAEEIRRWKRFVQAYREAWEDFKKGVSTAAFPVGTYGIKRLLRVTVDPPPASAET